MKKAIKTFLFPRYLTLEQARDTEHVLQQQCCSTWQQFPDVAKSLPVNGFYDNTYCCTEAADLFFQRIQTLIRGDHGLLSEVSHITGGQLKIMNRPSTVALHQHSAQVTLD